eukprot:NODE_72_length_23514_cov_0.560624.p1 type:complete len:869 gc:universal NODE_72_length_23514_cov_0.560624:10001-12607(+)
MHSISTEESLRLLNSTMTGLSEQQHELKLKEFGYNEIPDGEQPTWFEMIKEQFEDTLVRILLGAALVSFALAVEEYYEGTEVHIAMAFAEPLVILLILIANAVVGILQESNALQAINALKEYTPDQCHAFVNNQLVVRLAKFLVPGDVVELRTGNVVPADCRILSINGNLRIDQSILTGESSSVYKTVSIVSNHKVLQDLTNILFSGTLVVSGSCKALVVKTALSTELGKIHSEISNEEDQKSPLKKKLDEFGDALAKWIAVICILVWIMNINHFSDKQHDYWLKGAIYYFKIAVSLAVAAIPEGLAVVITTCLALGTKRMAKKNAIVRHLPSVETLGCCDVICSDKTGTLTTNQMCVEQLFVLQSSSSINSYSVTGNGYSPIGTISPNPSTIPALLVNCASYCNDSFIEHDSNHYKCIGEPTEAALRCFVEKCNPTMQHDGMSGMSYNNELASTTIKSHTFEFSRDRKAMSVVIHPKRQTRLSKSTLYVKGAPEQLLAKCTHALINNQTIPLTNAIKSLILNQLNVYATKALRCLLFAYKELDDTTCNYINTTAVESNEYTSIESDLTFISIIAMRDPPRQLVNDSITTCVQAGIKVIVITGDNQVTAESICKDIGLFTSNQLSSNKQTPVHLRWSITGAEWDSLSTEDKQISVENCLLFSRTEPQHKSQLIQYLQANSHTVAMTGDGVNDAIALKKADIGIAMGSGTDVAKHASDMILQDDDFNTIIHAIREGRQIYNNTKQFIRYLISSNIGEVVSIFLTVLMGMPEALIPVQLLWVNLVTDGLPATALGFNPSDSEIMVRGPRKASDPLVGRWLFIRYMIIGMYVGFATVFGYAWYYMYYVNGPLISLKELVIITNVAGIFSIR